MTGKEIDALTALELRLFGQDDGRTEGAIGAINAQLAPVTEFYQQATGVLRVVKWLGGGLAVTAIAAIAKGAGLL